jgi:starvation-inducible outer membrane lipoprotein
MMCIKGSILSAAFALLLAGCSTSSHVLLGTPRPPIAPEQVRVYAQPPAHYQQIASINANSSG